MKSILFYDTNIFSFLNESQISDLVNDYDGYITDDVVKELLIAKDNYKHNKIFQKKLNLIFNKKQGLNDNITLVISHVPFGLGDTYENTKNVYIPKSNPFICSMHHMWLPEIICPALITDPMRHFNSQLTWRLRRGDISYKEIEDIKNKIRLEEIKNANPYIDGTALPAKKIVKSWAKRDTDVCNGKIKITDYRLVMHLLNTMILKEKSVKIITADYDLVDLTITLLSCLVDRYVVNEVLTEYCKCINLRIDEHIPICVPMSRFVEKHRQVVERIQSDNEYLSITIMFYDAVNKVVKPQVKAFPIWLLKFAVMYKGLLDCYSIGKGLYCEYPIRYIWDQNKSPDFDHATFEVWKKDVNKFEGIEGTATCSLWCKYENQEINDPYSMGGYLLPLSES